ncbi:YdcF family protein [Citrobacter sp. Ct235]|uniref:YdcF family protein n=1 Tax=Citrobacter sp. Ct235 TaxID=2985157 RepID=UPI00336C0D91
MQHIVRVVTFLIVVIAAVFTWNAVVIYQFSLEDETRPADCAIVAGAGVDGGRPSPVFEARLNHAIWLYQQGLVRALVLTGGYSAGASASDAAIARQYVLGKGVPARAIFIEEHSTITRENIRYAKQILLRQRWHTALLVSDPLHMRRLKTLAEDDGIESWSSPTSSTRYQTWLAQARFLLRESFYYSGYLILRHTPVQNNSIPE